MRILVYGAIVLAAVVTFLYWGLTEYYTPERVQWELTERFSAFLDRPVYLRKLEWSFFPLPAIVATEVQVLGEDQELLLRVPRVRMTVIPWSIRKKQILISETAFYEPELRIKVEPGKELGIQKLIRELRERWKVALRVEQKKIFFREFVIHKGKVTFFKADGSGTKWSHELLIEGKGRVHLKERRFTFSAVARGASKKSLGISRLSGRIGETTRMDGDVSGLPVESFSSLWPQAARLNGQVNARGWFIKEGQKEALWSLRGDLSSLAFKRPGPEVEGNGTWAYGSDRPFSVAMQAMSPRSNVRLNVTFPDLPERTAVFDFTSTRFHLGDVLSWVAPLQSERKDHESSSWTARGHAQIESGSIGNFAFSNATAELRINDGQWQFWDLSGSLLGGKVDGSLILDTRRYSSGARSWLKFSGKVREVRAERLLALWQSTPTVIGLLTIRGDLSGRISPKFIEKANGGIRFEVRDGGLSEFSTLLKVISKFNLRSVFSRKSKEQKHALIAYAFNTLDGDIQFKDGKILTDNLTMESDTLSLKARATIDMVGRTVDARVSIRVLTLVDEILKRVPLVSKIYKKTKSIVPLWARVRGKLGKPDIVVDKPSGSN